MLVSLRRSLCIGFPPGTPVSTHTFDSGSTARLAYIFEKGAVGDPTQKKANRAGTEL